MFPVFLVLFPGTLDNEDMKEMVNNMDFSVFYNERKNKNKNKRRNTLKRDAFDTHM